MNHKQTNSIFFVLFHKPLLVKALNEQITFLRRFSKLRIAEPHAKPQPQSKIRVLGELRYHFQNLNFIIGFSFCTTIG